MLGFGTMRYSDRLVHQALAEMTAGETRAITIDEISEVSGVSHTTTRTAILRLIRDGKIHREGPGRRWGYYYEVLDD